MGDNTLNTRSDGQVISSSDVNQYKTALNEDLVPRNSSGVATNEGGNLGNSTYEWKKANIVTGYFVCGQIIMFHDFNGTVSPGQGWMLCNGDVVNSTNYDALHSAGDWTTYIGSSPLSGLNLPDFADRYPIGKDATTQDGSVAITSVGNASNQTDSSHTHNVTTSNHNHLYLNHVDSGGVVESRGYTSAGATQDITSFTVSGGGAGNGSFTFATTSATGSKGLTSDDLYTANDGGETVTSATGGSSTLDITPDSIEVQYWIRII